MENYFTYSKGIGEIQERKEPPVFYICDCYRLDDKEFNLFPPHCLFGTEGANIIEELKPSKDDFIVIFVPTAGYTHESGCERKPCLLDTHLAG